LNMAAAMAGAGGAPSVDNSEVITEAMKTILGISTKAEITALLGRLSLQGQRANMATRNNYVREKREAAIAFVLDEFKKLTKVEFAWGEDPAVTYEFNIPKKAPIKYNYVTGGAYGKIFKSVIGGGAGGAGAGAGAGAGGDPTILKLVKFQITNFFGDEVLNNIPQHEQRHGLRPDMAELIENENVARTFFIELYIQIVLNKDPDIGSYIPAIHNVYVDESSPAGKVSTRQVSRAAGAGAGAGAPPPENIAYITMDYIPDTFQSYCKTKYGTKGGDLEIEDIAPIFVQLGNLLQRLLGKYNFRHKDLHVGNIMINRDRLKLIDFGMACLQIDGTTYTVLDDRKRAEYNANPANFNCDSYDLLIFLVSLLEFYLEEIQEDAHGNPIRDAHGNIIYDYKFSDAAKRYIKNLLNFTHNNNVYNVYDLLVPHKGTDAVFHLTYPDRLGLVLLPGLTLHEACQRIPILNVDRNDFSNAFLPAAYRAGAIAAAAGVGAGGPRRTLTARCIGALCKWPPWPFAGGGKSRRHKKYRRRSVRRRFRT
jgi:serine/threonine protein kinase